MRHIQSAVMNHISRNMYYSLHGSLFQSECKSQVGTPQNENSLINYEKNQWQSPHKAYYGYVWLVIACNHTRHIKTIVSQSICRRLHWHSDYSLNIEVHHISFDSLFVTWLWILQLNVTNRLYVYDQPAHAMCLCSNVYWYRREAVRLSLIYTIPVRMTSKLIVKLLDTLEHEFNSYFLFRSDIFMIEIH